MRDGEPSRTAFGAARHRAVHQDVEHGVVFSDPLAWTILGDVDRRAVVDAERAPHRTALRLFIAARHRFAEDRVRAAVARGVRQVLVVGAGLDTFAYRGIGPNVDVVEIDHPATCRWKQERLVEADIEVPDTVRYLGVDFESDDLADALASAGIDGTAPTIAMWLGVVPYLTDAAVESTLGVLGAGMQAEVVFDYAAPGVGPLDEQVRHARDDLRARTAAVGEPLADPRPPTTIHAMLARTGFVDIDDLDRPAVRTRLLGLPPAGDAGGGHIVAASTRGR